MPYETYMRYSGALMISVVLRETPNGARYVCTIVDPDEQKETVEVKSPAVLTHPIDSKQAVTDAARAALAFAHDDGFDSIDEHGAIDEHGWFVSEDASSPWPFND